MIVTPERAEYKKGKTHWTSFNRAGKGLEVIPIQVYDSHLEGSDHMAGETVCLCAAGRLNQVNDDGCDPAHIFNVFRANQITELKPRSQSSGCTHAAGRATESARMVFLSDW